VTAFRLPRKPADTGQEPVDWQRSRRLILEQARPLVSIVA